MLVSSLRIPVPTSVEIHNVLPLYTSSNKTNNTHESLSTPTASNNWYRPEYTRTLLHSLKLDVSTLPDKTLYSNTIRTATIQPRWHNLHEQFSNLLVEEYESMTLQVTMQPNSDRSSIGSTSTVLKSSVHPSQLVRIARVPKKLPVNAVIIHYTDKTIRVSHKLYQLLRESGEEDVVVKKTAQLGNDYGRFQDDIFRTLDSVAPPVDHTFPTRTEKVKANTNSVDDDGTIGVFLHVPSDNNCDGTSNFDACLEEQLEEEVIQLEIALRLEERALASDMDKVLVSKHRLEELPELIQETQSRIQQVELQLEALNDEEAKSAHLIRAHQIVLIKDLSFIYPITKSGNHYKIQGLVIPNELLASSIAEDDLSAALGYACYLLYMMSKYLMVRPRYRLNCYASRSAIQDDKGQIYPLFLTRGVDRDQILYGYKLLNDIATCLAKSQGLRYSTRDVHLLENISRVIDKVVEG